MILSKPKIRSPGFHTQWEGGRERKRTGRRETGRGRGDGREKGRKGERKNNLRGTDREGNENECIKSSPEAWFKLGLPC